MSVQVGLFDAVQTDDEPLTDHEVIGELAAEFPQYDRDVLRPLCLHWRVRNRHRQHCDDCRAGRDCDLNAIYGGSISHALQKISERKK